jgi:hypothetical protein
MSKADADAWCGPTRELESAKLLELIHETKRKPEPEPPKPEPILLPMPAAIDPLPGQRLFGRRSRTRKPIYPVYRDGLGGVRIAIGIAVLAAIAIGVLMTIAV